MLVTPSFEAFSSEPLEHFYLLSTISKRLSQAKFITNNTGVNRLARLPEGISEEYSEQGFVGVGVRWVGEACVWPLSFVSQYSSFFPNVFPLVSLIKHSCIFPLSNYYILQILISDFHCRMIMIFGFWNVGEVDFQMTFRESLGPTATAETSPGRFTSHTVQNP